MRSQFLVGGLSILLLEPVVLPASAQIVQSEIVVPTINVFTVATTVSVPDRGGAYLGGSRNASTIRNEFGPGFGRNFASRTSASDATVHVWIHDFQELEDSLAKSDDREALRPTGFAGGLRHYAATRAEKDKAKGEEKSAKSKSASDELLAAKIDQAADLLKRGQDAESRGKWKIASLYYKSVIGLGSTPSARSARERLDALEKLASR